MTQRLFYAGSAGLQLAFLLMGLRDNMLWLTLTAGIGLGFSLDGWVRLARLHEAREVLHEAREAWTKSTNAVDKARESLERVIEAAKKAGL